MEQVTSRERVDAWCAVIPQKSLLRARGRTALPYLDRQASASSMLVDTVAAVRGAAGMERVPVVWEGPVHPMYGPGSRLHTPTPGSPISLGDTAVRRGDASTCTSIGRA